MLPLCQPAHTRADQNYQFKCVRMSSSMIVNQLWPEQRRKDKQNNLLSLQSIASHVRTSTRVMGKQRPQIPIGLVNFYSQTHITCESGLGMNVICVTDHLSDFNLSHNPRLLLSTKHSEAPDSSFALLRAPQWCISTLCPGFEPGPFAWKACLLPMCQTAHNRAD